MVKSMEEDFQNGLYAHFPGYPQIQLAAVAKSRRSTVIPSSPAMLSQLGLGASNVSIQLVHIIELDWWSD